MQQFYPKKGRVILHVDMNSFFASVEMAYDPTLKGKPLAIAGDEKQRKGIVVTCSYEARKFGIKTPMPLWEAKKLCSELLVRKPNFERYRQASQAMFELLRTFSDIVEPVSIDEGYIDISACQELGSPLEIADQIQQLLLNQLDLPCSIGIAPNKFLAKMASDMKKPLGITILRKREVPQILWPLPVVEMHGVGEKTAIKMASIQIQTIGDLAKAHDMQLRAALGIRGIKLKERANGEDIRPVDPEAAAENKSVGNSLTLPQDLANQAELLSVLEKLAKSVSARLKKKGYLTMNVGITIRYKDRKTITRSRKLRNSLIQSEEIFLEAKHLFIEHWNGDPVRLLGITGMDLIDEDQAYEQLNLFTFEKAAKLEPLHQVVSQLRDKYGDTIFKKGKDFK
ncbi:DNA polymerase IV [Bacillus sp. J14TS2]|uniref:DNA polymerase IV n=1 Tax=Bacillus sp. J14TS2 TaxID=2807188 RepID=UPI001B12F64E|nr:DNA polymerase IV [Bacillus sp. J14TS2]GIN73507.1 DNA polymerase IV [Bacillus sp. J14TS2]